MIASDAVNDLQEQVLNAKSDGIALQIQGGGSKRFYGLEPQGNLLDVSKHQGIINYQPSELVVTARTGTRVADLQTLLAESGQMLAFEPAEFDGVATLGGAIAWGLSGPRRPFTGSVRDFVLGCKLINGKGEVLQFGGEVMKNVAGYDVSRLMAGAMGTLGVLLEVSLKVLPLPQVEQSVCLEMQAEDALARMIALSGQCLPLSGLYYNNNRLFIRLSGYETAVNRAINQLGGEVLNDANVFWETIREYRTSLFNRSGEIWRLSVPPATPLMHISGELSLDWGGALRWFKTEISSDSVFKLAKDADGHATLFRSEKAKTCCFQPIPEPLAQLQYRIKRAFDPDAIFNPSRLNRA